GLFHPSLSTPPTSWTNVTCLSSCCAPSASLQPHARLSSPSGCSRLVPAAQHPPTLFPIPSLSLPLLPLVRETPTDRGTLTMLMRPLLLNSAALVPFVSSSSSASF